jgi:dihydroorotate dehydrogenase
MTEILQTIQIPPRKAVDIAFRNIAHPYLTRGEARADREVAHERALKYAGLADNPLIRGMLSKLFTYDDPILRTRLGQKLVRNPFGLAAGFDKDARIHDVLGNLGFGFITVGSITKIPYEGNPRPRIFDLPRNDGLINRMGFPGGGSDEAQRRLSATFGRRRDFALAISIAASKPSFEQGTVMKDYGDVFDQLIPYAGIMEVNVSSPNTPGVRGLQEPERFQELASELKMRRMGSSKGAATPLFYKFSDLPREKLEPVLKIAKDNGATGVTLTNTSTAQEVRDALHQERHSGEMGGVSGAILNERSTNTTRLAYEIMGEDLVIIRAGGVRPGGEDLWRALTYGGATAVEGYSSFVRSTTATPNYTYYPLRDLAKAMRMKGMESMDDFKDLRGKNVLYSLSQP